MYDVESCSVLPSRINLFPPIQSSSTLFNSINQPVKITMRLSILASSALFSLSLALAATPSCRGSHDGTCYSGCDGPCRKWNCVKRSWFTRLIFCSQRWPRRVKLGKLLVHSARKQLCPSLVDVIRGVINGSEHCRGLVYVSLFL